MMYQLVLLFVLALIVKKWLKDRKYQDFDGPSPFLSLPFFGHGYLLGKDPTNNLTKYQEKYGDVFRFDLGPEPTIVICSHKLVKEAFTKEVFSGRFWNMIPTFTDIWPRGTDGQNKFGVMLSDGKIWQEQRKFMVKNLSDLGMGKRDTMEDVIEQEAEELAEKWKQNVGKPIVTRGMYTCATNNVIWRIATGKRTRQDDPELIDLTDRIVANFRTMDPSNPLGLLQMNSLPFAKLCRLVGLPNFLTTSKKVMDMIAREVYGSSPNESGNYVEKALSERERDISNGFESILGSPGGRERLISQLTELFVAGTDTTAGSMEWITLYLVKYPEVQEKLFQEVKLTTGDNNRRISLADKQNMHFIHAFIDEVSRHCPMGFVVPPHKTLSDTVLQGKRIPKDTQVVYFNYGINQDESRFANPREFRPERFLDANGAFQKDEGVLFFGLGKRRCPGELLARAELFLFTTRLVQQFKLGAANPKELTFDATPGLVFYAKPFQLLAQERSGLSF